MAKSNAITPGMQEATWVSVLKGVVFILFGIVAIAWPGITLINLAWLFAVYILFVGAFDLVSGIMHAGREDFWWLKLIIGIIGIGVGVYLLKEGTLVQLSTFIFVVGFLLIIRGVLELVLGFAPGLESSTRAILIIVGLVAIIAGFVILRYPVTSGLAFTWVLGLYALISGPIIIGLALMNHNK